MKWFDRLRRWPLLRQARQAVQILAMVGFVYLLFAALQRRAALPWADLFFRLDPLVALTAMLAGRAWIPRLALALIILVLTLGLGRVWCGWLCPLGALLEWTRFASASKRAARLSNGWRSLKNILLIVTLAAALFGNLSLLILDPITLLTRAMTMVILPLLNHAITALEAWIYPVPLFQPLVHEIEVLLRGTVLPVKPPVFGGHILIALLMGGIIALNALSDRFWCRYVCPLGALLGWLSKIALLRPVIGAACHRCGQCVGDCRLGAIQPAAQGFDLAAGECVVCLDCLAGCPAAGIEFRLSRPDLRRPFDPTRRQLLAGLVVGAVGAALAQTDARARRPDPHLIRPPGVSSQDEFLSRCVRCSQCIKVCPTSGLQPALWEGGLSGVWTPVLTPRLGHCDYGCNACGQVCPSGAIPPLTLISKRHFKIGLAAIDRDRCLPWAYGVPCIVCEEMCPVPTKAIALITDADTGLQKPVVRSEVCIGCGICEYQCPMEGQAAIRVYRLEG